MKTCSVEINKKEYTLALTMDAFNAIAERLGGIENIGELFKAKKMQETYTETLEILSILLAGGRAYARLAEGREEESLPLESLKILCSATDAFSLRLKVMEAVTLGLTREVEVETDRKNAETTQMTP